MQPAKPAKPIEPVFIETSAFYALMDRSDQYHESAKAIWPSLLENHITLFTSNYVVSETMKLLQFGLGYEAAILWHKAMLGVVDVKWVDQDTHRQGYELWMNLGRRNCSLVDCVSYIIMNRFQAEKAFCFKSNYADQGFILLPEQVSPLRRADSKS